MEAIPSQKESGSLFSSHHDPEKAQLLQAYHTDQPSSASQEEAARPRERMPSPKHLLTTIFLALLITFGLAAVVVPRNGMPCHDARSHHDQLPAAEGRDPLSEPGSRSFSEIVHTVSPHSLHRILSTYFPNRYKQGVFESEHRAMEAIHADDAGLATTLVEIAKRQDSNSTTSTPTSSPTSISTTTTPTDTPTSSPKTTSTPDPTTPTPEPTTPTPEPTTPTPKPSTTSKPTTTSKPPTSSSKPPSTTTTAPPPPATTASKTSTSIVPSKTTKPVTATFTSTKPNGEVTVVTSTSVVVEDVPTSATGAAGSLQTEGAASVPRIPPLAALAGAIFGGLALV